MQQPASALAARRRPAPLRAGTTAALRGVALVPGEPAARSGPGAAAEAARLELAGQDSPVWRRVLPDSLVLGRTVRVAKACKRAPEVPGAATSPPSARPSIP